MVGLLEEVPVGQEFPGQLLDVVHVVLATGVVHRVGRGALGALVSERVACAAAAAASAAVLHEPVIALQHDQVAEEEDEDARSGEVPDVIHAVSMSTLPRHH